MMASNMTTKSKAWRAKSFFVTCLQVELYINGRLWGIGVALMVLIGVRFLTLLMLRLVQTSTFNALVARRHLSEAHGWLFTTRPATVSR